MLDKNEDPTKIGKKEKWNIPFKILAFMESRILQFVNEPAKKDKFEMMEWDFFKEVIFEIYDHRIKYAPELNGTVNTNYCVMNEHLILYFVDKYRVRRKAEDKIFDLLINLRYYFDYWQRAKLFANNL